MISSELQNRRRVQRVVSKNLAALLVSWMCISGAALVSYAQDRSVTMAGSYSHSPGTGHEDGLGVLGEFVLTIPKLEQLRVVVSTQFEYAAKSYLGNGTVLRSSIEGRYYLGDAQLGRQLLPRPYGMLGYAVVNNTTTGPGGYSKTASFLIAGAGGSFAKQRVIVGWQHYFREQQTQNKVASDKFQLDLYLPLAEQSHWLARARVFTQRTTFTQPNGPAAGKHTSWSYGGMLGAGYRW